MSARSSAGEPARVRGVASDSREASCILEALDRFGVRVAEGQRQHTFFARDFDKLAREALAALTGSVSLDKSSEPVVQDSLPESDWHSLASPGTRPKLRLVR